MIASVPIDVALGDRRLLGAALGDLATWTAWIAVLKAAYGRRLNERERKLFAQVAGGREPPTSKVKELVAVVSRRGGKGRAAGGLATYEAALVDHSRELAPGEVGVVACISPTRAQAAIVQNYTLGYFQASPILRKEIADVTGDEIKLCNGVVICTLASDYRTLRGRTLLLAILDEAAFLRSEESSTPDVECARALLPGLSTTGGMLCILSSPYRQAGLLFQRHRDHFGKDGDVLVVTGPTELFNPTLSKATIEAAVAADPEAAAAEWLGLFRRDLQTFLPDDLIDAAVDRGRPFELPPQEDVRYRVFVDASGGAHDWFTASICHREGQRVVCDVIRGRRPPFDPHAVAHEYAVLARQYHCCSIVGDAYGAAWTRTAFEGEGIEYRRSPLTRSELYLEGLPLFSRGQIAIPDHAPLLRELRLLQRRTTRAGKDSVDHGVGGSDDHANVLFGAMHLCAEPPEVVAFDPIATVVRQPYLGDHPEAGWDALVASGPVECPARISALREADRRARADGGVGGVCGLEHLGIW